MIRIPTVSSYAWQYYKEDWIQLDAPRHFYLHSVDSLKFLADKSGFIIERIIDDSDAFQFWGSEQYQMDIPLRDPRSYDESKRRSVFSSKMIREFSIKANELNQKRQGDQIIIYLKKP